MRNSYATYAQTFRSSGDVARAMSDAESTVKRFYVRTLEPGVGKDWFDVQEKDGPVAKSRTVSDRNPSSDPPEEFWQLT